VTNKFAIGAGDEMAASRATSEQTARTATVIAVVIAAIAFFDSARNNRQSTHAQTQAVAVGLFQDYIKWQSNTLILLTT
jgi:hypothetical protein